MEPRTDLVSTSDRFNAFHLAVAVYQERCAFVLEHIGVDHAGLGLLQQLNDDLLALIGQQNCN